MKESLNQNCIGVLFLMIIPIFRIFDIEKTHSFYIKYLGFKMDWKHQYEENMPLYFQVSLNDAVLHLSEHHGDSSPGSAIRIKINELKSYHSLLSEKEYSYAKPGVEKTPWGTIELTVIDPFSNKITFYEEIE
ncbi:glyoxalase superfamily protein [Metabacillus sp. FJAT-53654]|uniref:Bleomycin resistance protein n=2 Tax=Metabacillus rhizosphaerae TaxID=3117747 RepID=A0ABZ2MPF3_9BACI